MACVSAVIRCRNHHFAALLRDLIARQQAILAHCVVYCLQRKRWYLNAVQSFVEDTVAIEIFVGFEVKALLENIVINVLQS